MIRRAPLSAVLVVLAGCQVHRDAEIPLTAELGTTAPQQQVQIHVLDIGPGLACVVTMPGDAEQAHRYMIYDAGYWTSGGRPTADAIAEIIPEESEVELLVLSHSDADHISAVDEICDAYTVKNILRTGYERTTGSWQNANGAIDIEEDSEGAVDYNLSEIELLPGSCFRFGDVFVQFVCGFDQPPDEWTGLNQSKRRNSISICIRLLYEGRSVLFAGDAVGRQDDSPAGAPAIATERFMIDNSPVILLDSDVLIAPHHGADNASSTEFIDAVDPEWVIFSAGHDHEHPRASTAQRYIDAGVAVDHMLRTDRGDDEGGDEWDHGQDNGDETRDDDIVITIGADGTLTVGYIDQG